MVRALAQRARRIALPSWAALLLTISPLLRTVEASAPAQIVPSPGVALADATATPPPTPLGLPNTPTPTPTWVFPNTPTPTPTPAILPRTPTPPRALLNLTTDSPTHAPTSTLTPIPTPVRPSNDNFVNAQVLGIPSTVTISLEGATLEPDEPDPTCAGANVGSVWFRLTVGSSGGLTAVLVRSTPFSVHPVLTLHAGSSLSALTEIGCAVEGPVGSSLRLGASVTAGQTYYLRVRGFPERPEYTLEVSFGPTPTPTVRPSNDSFANAQVLSIPSTVTGPFAGAGTEAGEPSPSCFPAQPLPSVWFRLIPGSSGVLTVSASFAPRVLTLYTGSSLPTLTEIACNQLFSTGDFFVGPLLANVTAGQTYHLRLGSRRGYFDRYTFQVSLDPTHVAPANDNFANARVLSLPGASTISLVGATVEAGEPSPSCFPPGPPGPVRSVWFRFTPDRSGALRVSAAGSRGPVGLALYTGSSLSSLAELACSDDVSDVFPLPTAHLAAHVTAGQAYSLRLADLLSESSGSYTLQGALRAPPRTGGTDLTISPGASSVGLRWRDGSLQAGYAVARFTSAGVAILPSSGLLGAHATELVDSSPPPGPVCYLLLPIGKSPATPLGLSDLLCTVPGTRSATGVPQNLTLTLEETNVARLTWSAPASGAGDGYAIFLLPTGGQFHRFGSGRTSASLELSGFTCFMVAPTSGGRPIGNSDVVCGMPGVSTLRTAGSIPENG